MRGLRNHQVPQFCVPLQALQGLDTWSMALMTPESAVHTLLGTHFQELVGPPSHLASFTAHSLQGVKAEKGPAPRSRRGVERAWGWDRRLPALGLVGSPWLCTRMEH